MPEGLKKSSVPSWKRPLGTNLGVALREARVEGASEEEATFVREMVRLRDKTFRRRALEAGRKAR